MRRCRPGGQGQGGLTGARNGLGNPPGAVGSGALRASMVKERRRCVTGITAVGRARCPPAKKEMRSVAESRRGPPAPRSGEGIRGCGMEGSPRAAPRRAQRAGEGAAAHAHRAVEGQEGLGHDLGAEGRARGLRSLQVAARAAALIVTRAAGGETGITVEAAGPAEKVRGRCEVDSAGRAQARTTPWCG